LSRIIVGLLVVALILVAGAQFFLPYVVERGAEAALNRVLGTGDLDVKLATRPSLELLLGRIDVLSVKTTGIERGGLVVAELTTTVRDLQVDLKTLFLEGKLKVLKTGRETTRLVVTESALNDYLQAQLGKFQPRLGLGEDGGVHFEAQLPIDRERGLEISAAGRFIVTPAGTVAFAVDDLWLNGLEVDGELRENLLQTFGPWYLTLDLESLPVPVKAEKVEIENDAVIITGEPADD